MLRNPHPGASQPPLQRLAQCKAPLAFICAGLIAGALLPSGTGDAITPGPHPAVTCPAASPDASSQTGQSRQAQPLTSHSEDPRQPS